MYLPPGHVGDEPDDDVHGIRRDVLGTFVPMYAAGILAEFVVVFHPSYLGIGPWTIPAIVLGTSLAFASIYAAVIFCCGRSDP